MKKLALIIVGASLCVVACQSQVDTLAKNKEIVKLFYDEIINKGNFNTADEIIAAEFRHNTKSGDKSTGKGPEYIKKVILGFRETFPDIHYTIGDIIAEGDKVVVRWSGTGTQKGRWNNHPPTNIKANWTGIFIHRIVDKKIMED